MKVGVTKYFCLHAIRPGTPRTAASSDNRPLYQNRQNPYSSKLFGELGHVKPLNKMGRAGKLAGRQGGGPAGCRVGWPVGRRAVQPAGSKGVDPTSGAGPCPKVFWTRGQANWQMHDHGVLPDMSRCTGRQWTHTCCEKNICKEVMGMYML